MNMQGLETRAWELCDVGQLRLATFDLPEPADDELVVSVNRAGICGSDLATFCGSHPYKVPPTVLGHELSGTVEYRGSAVSRVEPGDAVVSSSFASCGQCHRCESGSMQLCEGRVNLSHRGWIGAFSEKVILKESMVLPIPPRVHVANAVLAEPLAVSVHALKMAGDPGGRRMAIVGLGGVGLGCAFAARHFGWRDIVGSDIDELKGDRGSSVGITEYLDGSSSSRMAGDPDARPEVVIVCSGHPGAIEAAQKLVSPGGTVVVVAFFDGAESLDVSSLVRREVNLIGSSLCTTDDLRVALSLLEGEPDLARSITHEYQFEEVPIALAVADSGSPSVGKVVVNMDGNG